MEVPDKAFFMLFCLVFPRAVSSPHTHRHRGVQPPARGPGRPSCSWTQLQLCSCQEFLGADRMCCWLQWHRTPRNAWEHMDLLPGGMRRPCQAPAEFQACATLCCSPSAAEQAGGSRIQRSSCCGVRLRILWWRWLGWQMEEGEVCFLDILQPFYIFAASRIWSKNSAMKIFLCWVYIWVLSHLKSWSPYFISISSLSLFFSFSFSINQPRNELTSKEGHSSKCSIIFRL